MHAIDCMYEPTACTVLSSASAPPGPPGPVNISVYSLEWAAVDGEMQCLYACDELRRNFCERVLAYYYEGSEGTASGFC